MSNPFGNFPQSIGQNITNGRPDYSSNIIKSPEPNITSGRIADTLLIDSRDRDYSTYPNSNSYKIHFNRQYRDVVAIKLVKGMIPHSGFYISSQNNTIYFSEGSINYTVSITTGYYTQAELFTAIKTAMDATGSNTYSVALTTDQKRNVIITANDTFKLQFLSASGSYLENSMGPLLGFPPRNSLLPSTTQTGSYPFCENIDEEPYVAIHIDEAPNIDALGRGTDQAFAIIPLQSGNTDGCGREFFGKHTANNGETVKHYNPPIGTLRSMTIKFKKYDGSIYDFNGKEHFLMFDIYTLNANQKYPHT